MNEYIEVRTQAELDAALAKPDVVPICIGDGRFRAYDSVHVEASDSAHVEASGSAHVEAYGSAQVEASGSAHVEAYDSAHVRAYGSAHVEAYGSAHVRAYDSAHVEASDSAHVRVYDSAHVEASGSAQVEASRYVAITRRGTTAKVNGGVLIQIPEITTAEEWCDYYGAQVINGVATLFKAVDDDYSTRNARSRGVFYTPGSQPKAPDWDGGKAECGGGLHFCPRPILARGFNDEATRYVACPVRLDEIVVHKNPSHPTKIKAPGVCGPVFEVTIDGDPVAEQVGSVA